MMQERTLLLLFLIACIVIFSVAIVFGMPTQ